MLQDFDQMINLFAPILIATNERVLDVFSQLNISAEILSEPAYILDAHWSKIAVQSSATLNSTAFESQAILVKSRIYSRCANMCVVVNCLEKTPLGLVLPLAGYMCDGF